MNWLLSIHWALIASVWYFGNGVLHDAFVLIKHKGKYDRELLRLLMDGHVLMLSSAIVFVCYLMMLNKIQCGGLISIIVAAFMQEAKINCLDLSFKPDTGDSITFMMHLCTADQQ